MKIKIKYLVLIWFFCVIVFLSILLSGILKIHPVSQFSVNNNCLLEEQMSTLPNLKVIEKEEEVEIKKINNIYNFPFAVGEEKKLNVVGSCSCCLPTKKYSNMRNNNEVVIYASESQFKEGSLIWVEGVGIRQVQSLKENTENLYLCFDTHEEAIQFNSNVVSVFEILE